MFDLRLPAVTRFTKHNIDGLQQGLTIPASAAMKLMILSLMGILKKSKTLGPFCGDYFSNNFKSFWKKHFRRQHCLNVSAVNLPENVLN